MTTETPVVVCLVHQNSGPGYVVYACQACALHYPPEPHEHTVVCTPRRTGGER